MSGKSVVEVVEKIVTPGDNTISGTIVSEDGRPLAARVSFRDEDGVSRGGPHPDWPGAWVAGEFSIPGYVFPRMW